MIDMMDVITQGEGGWLPQTNTHVFTDILTNIDTDTNKYTCTNIHIYLYIYIYSIQMIYMMDGIAQPQGQGGWCAQTNTSM